MFPPSDFIKFLEELSRHEVSSAGGKGANLGEMYGSSFPVPAAFVVTTKAYYAFEKATNLEDMTKRILSGIQVEDIGKLETVARRIRKIIVSAAIPEEVANGVRRAYKELSRREGQRGIAVAVRSSAVAEDLKDASFAGQQSSYLNIRGVDELMSAIRKCWASVYTGRAIYYREKKGFGLRTIPTAVVVQKQIFSEKAGVGFTIHPVTGEKHVIVIEGAWGQGEAVVSGSSTPDTFILDKATGEKIEQRIATKKRMKVQRKEGLGLVNVDVSSELRDKPTLDVNELSDLWRLACRLEEHYNHPQDFEWTIENEKVYLVQTRPVTVIAERKEIGEALDIRPVLKGLPASPGIGTGQVAQVRDMKDLSRVQQGEVLVTKMTTPDYVPVMMRTSAIVTDEGGMTSHASIVSRELGIPCVVGTGSATTVLPEGSVVTVDGSRGFVFEGHIPLQNSSRIPPEEVERVAKLGLRTKIYMNLGVPEKIRDYRHLPFDGIGLMRIEFIIASYIGEHPLSLIEMGKHQKFVERLSQGIAEVATACFPRPVVVRFSDFKSNEYRELKGGEKHEEVESNPMLGWRGVSRYVSEDYLPAFRLELEALRRVRDDFELHNVWAMLPFVRTTWEVEKCLAVMEERGLVRGNSFKVWLMAEVPSIFLMADEFARLCDGFSVGSNDLTQLMLGIDRDSSRLGKMGYFDERNEAVKRAIACLIDAAHKRERTVSICGQAPSVYPELAEYLVNLGIDSLSVNPDTVITTRRFVYEAENRLKKTPHLPERSGADELAQASTPA